MIARSQLKVGGQYRDSTKAIFTVKYIGDKYLLAHSSSVNNEISDTIEEFCQHASLLPKKKVGWVNVYKKYKERKTGFVYDSARDANKAALKGPSFVGTFKFEWEE